MRYRQPETDTNVPFVPTEKEIWEHAAQIREENLRRMAASGATNKPRHSCESTPTVVPPEELIDNFSE